MYKTLNDQYENEDLLRIQLTQEPFKGIVYHYTTVNIKEPTNEGDDAHLQFHYNVDETPENINIDEFDQNTLNKFETMLGDVLIDVIEKTMLFEDANATRNDNSDESSV